MRYFLIDRVIRLERSKRIIAVKCAALSEDVFLDHFFGAPVMPGALLLESMAQAATVLLEYSSGFKKKAIFVMVEQAKFRRIVKPGDQLEIELEILTNDATAVQLDGRIRVKEQIVCDGRLTFSLDEAERFYPKKTRHMVESLYDTWLQDTEIIE